MIPIDWARWFLCCSCLVLFTGTALANGAYNDVVRSRSGTYVAVGKAGNIVYTMNPETWGTSNSGTTQNLNAVAWSEAGFVTVGDNGTILTSTDGINWVSQLSNTNEKFTDIIWSGQFYVAFNEGATAYTSSDGVLWSYRLLSDPLLFGLIQTNEQFASLDYSGSVIKSPDGLMWKIVQDVGETSLKKVSWDGLNIVVHEKTYGVTALVQPVLYQSWLDQTGLLGPARDFMSDPNQDGINNLVAYSLGIEAAVMLPENDSGAIPRMKFSGAVKSFSFKRPRNERSDVRYIIESSSDLQANQWLAIASRDPYGIWEGTASVSESLDDGNRISVEVSSDLWMGSELMFLRLRVDYLNSE